MAEGSERDQSAKDIVTEAKAKAVDDVNKASTQEQKDDLAKAIAKDLQEIKIIAQEFLTVEAYAKARRATHTPETVKKGNDALSTLVYAAEAAKRGIKVSKTTEGQLLLEKLADKRFTYASDASSIIVHLADFLTGEKFIVVSGTKTPDFEASLKNLANSDPKNAKIIAQAIIESYSTFGLTEVQARAKFELKEQKPVGKKQAREEEFQQQQQANFEQGHWAQTYSVHFGEDADYDLLNAIHVPDKFIDLIEKYKNDIREEIQNNKDNSAKTITEEELSKEVSKKIEERLFGIFTRLFTRLDRTMPEKFFEEIVQENPFHGIQAALQTLGSSMDALSTTLSRWEKEGHRNIDKINLVKKAEQERLEEMIPYTFKDENGKEQTIMKPRFRLRPLSQKKEVKMSEYVTYLRFMMDFYTSARQYTHNSKAILFHPAGEHGFFGQLGEFAEKLRAPELDELFLFPEADLFRDALNLYDILLEDELAFQDWKHTPDGFTNTPGSVLSRMEQKVLETLKKMHPEIDDERRFESALSMAIGASRGIFMTEEEKCAYADAALTPDGKPTYTSYYTNDTAAIGVLNPAHFFWRWQAQKSLPMWLFLPVEGMFPIEGLPTTGMWDHRVLYERLIKYKETFLTGKKEMQKQPLLIDFMMDIGNAGGPSKRKGWRMFYSSQGNFIYEDQKEGEPKEGESTKKLNFLKTWKAIEKVGYELAYDFIYNGDSYDVSNYRSTLTNPAERKEFFSYLYQEYFIDNPTTFKESVLNTFLTSLQGKAEEVANIKNKLGQVGKGELNDQIEYERSKLFLSHTLARLVAKRFPSKILRIDRGRFSEDGESRWYKTWQRMVKKEPEKYATLKFSDFHKVMQTIGLAEALLRKKVSSKIKKKIKKKKKQGKPKIGLDELEGIDFKLNESTIRQLLENEAKDITPIEIDQAVDLYKILKEDYIGLDSAKGKKFFDEFALYLNPAFSEEGGYTFTFGLPDTDFSFVTFRGTGPRLVARAIKDTAQIEQKVVGNIFKLDETLRTMAGDGKQDFEPLVQILYEIKNALEEIHGADYAQKVAHHIALAAIHFFKKDTIARNIITKGFVVGQPHSVAAEILGGEFSNIWEWDVGVIDKLCFRLRQLQILPQKPYDSTKGEFEMKKEEITDIFGRKKTIEHKVRRKPDFIWYEGSARRDAGVQIKHKVWEIANSVLPLLAIWLLWQYISKAFKEFGGQKQGAPA